MKYVYAKRTDTDCFIVIEDEHGNKQYARDVELQGTSISMYADPVIKYDGSEFRSAGVFVRCTGVFIVKACDENGVPISRSD